ncbi:MAG TPA: hypothetical protein DEH78_33325 [Solibacterales bacterium]|nr:hypothetical protein [Bryobacterales bacterium]
MAVVVKKKRLYNPQGKRRAAHKARRNPAELITLGLVNPHTKGNTVKKHKTTKKAASRKTNPWGFKAAANKSQPQPKRRRNPSRGGALQKPIELAKTGAIALGGLVITRQIPQLALGTRNSGWMGYGANALVALIAAWIVSRFNPNAGAAVGLGGSLYTVSRILTEQLSPVGKYFALSGIGDASAAGLGEVRKGYFPVPVVHDDSGNPIIPQQILDASLAYVRQQLPAATPAPTNMSGLDRYSR